MRQNVYEHYRVEVQDPGISLRPSHSHEGSVSENTWHKHPHKKLVVEGHRYLTKHTFYSQEFNNSCADCNTDV